MRPWSTKKEESAYDLSKGKYSEFKGTINLLVEDLLNRDESKHDNGENYRKEKDISMTKSVQLDSTVGFQAGDTQIQFFGEQFLSVQQL